MLGRIIYGIGAFIEVLILLRFVLRLLGANADNALVNLIYNWSTPFVAPFSGIFGQEATVVQGIGTATQGVFDWTALIALVVIGLIVGVIGSVLGGRRI